MVIQTIFMINSQIDYESVISSVGSILLAYDSDGAVPTFGFGAKLSGSCMPNITSLS